MTSSCTATSIDIAARFRVNVFSSASASILERDKDINLEWARSGIVGQVLVRRGSASYS